MNKITKDFTNKKIGRLTVISFYGNHPKQNRPAWNCKCDCGNSVIITSTSLNLGRNKSCGCLKQEILKSKDRRKNLIGQKFNRLTVIEFSHVDKWRNTNWKCRCDCGNIKITPDRYLKQNKVKSCGCLREEQDATPHHKDIIGHKFGKLTVIKRIGSKKHKNSKKLVLWECLCDCGGKINVITAALGRTTNSCGCLNNRRGKDSPHWNPDISEYDRILGRKIEGYSEWRKSVFERDRYKCRLSNSRYGGICAHHIEAWNINKELRLEVSNGITLSKPIHILFHSIYGRGYNTAQQFNEFKERYYTGEFNSLLPTDLMSTFPKLPDYTPSVVQN